MTARESPAELARKFHESSCQKQHRLPLKRRKIAALDTDSGIKTCLATYLKHNQDFIVANKCQDSVPQLMCM